MILNFKPESKEFEEDTKEYISIWKREKNNIITEFKKVTGLNFIHDEISIVIYEGPSWAGKKRKTNEAEG
jgi:hypothetical protein